MPELRSSPGFRFLEETKLSREGLLERRREEIAPAPWFKTYPDARRLPLPAPSFPRADLWEVLLRRRTVRRYAPGPLPLEAVSLLLFAAQGVTGRAGRYLLRTAPSAGALYPVETYLVVNDVAGLAPGLYHFEVQGFALEELRLGALGRELAEACLGQPQCAQAQVVFVWSAVLRRTMSKYGSRGVRYVLMDVAHVCQNLLLAAEALGLGACPIGAFLDRELDALLGLSGEEETALYAATVGRR